VRVLVAGSSGFLGSALVARLRAEGTEVHRVVRDRSGTQGAVFDSKLRTLDLAALPGRTLDGFDAVYAVGGDPLTPRRWGPAKREKIKSSRIDLLDALARALAATGSGQSVLVSMSAVGIYGERGDEELTEASAAGTGFIADLCRAWEGAAAPARTNGTRVVSARAGIIFGGGGGYIGKLAPLFRLGLGARLGNGRQWMSWIALDDAIEGLIRLGTDTNFCGPVNLTAPHPIRNGEFTKLFARALHRPAPLSIPRTAIVAATGRRVANEFVLQSARVLPASLTTAGFTFQHPEPADAIAASLATTTRA
jgi:uncharacterized protein (TIGR01777 family)